MVNLSPRCKGIQIPESGYFFLFVEFGIQLMIGTRGSSSMDKASGFQYLESGIHGMESRIQQCLGFLYIGRTIRFEFTVTS